MAFLPNSSPFLSKPLFRRFSRNRAAVAIATGLLATGVHAQDFTVQIGAFSVKPNSSFTEQAAEYGEVLVLEGDDGITRVSIGRYPDRTVAREVLARLQMAGYLDAYVANVSGRDTPPLASSSTTSPTSTSLPSSPSPSVAIQPPKAAPPAQRPTPASATRTITNPSTASSQRLPSNQQIVTPKRPADLSPNDSSAQAGRFRLRTHDTQSGETTDLKLGGGQTQMPAPRPRSAVAAGTSVNDIPAHLRERLVYLDGVPHIKEGDRFIPLTDAIDGKP